MGLGFAKILWVCVRIVWESRGVGFKDPAGMG